MLCCFMLRCFTVVAQARARSFAAGDPSESDARSSAWRTRVQAGVRCGGAIHHLFRHGENRVLLVIPDAGRARGLERSLRCGGFSLSGYFLTTRVNSGTFIFMVVCRQSVACAISWPRQLTSVVSLFYLFFAASGCAMRCGNIGNGVERTWGLGQVTWSVAQSTNGWATVGAGTHLPGLVLDVGPDCFGISFGYQVREILVAFPAKNLGGVSATVNGHELPTSKGHRWVIGQFTLRTPATGQVAVVNGRADIGIGAGIERGWPTATVGWQSRELTTVSGEDVLVELTVPPARWPHFDLSSADVTLMTATNTTARSIAQ